MLALISVSTDYFIKELLLFYYLKVVRMLANGMGEIMKTRNVITSCIASYFLCAGATTLAEDQTQIQDQIQQRNQTQTQDQDQDRIRTQDRTIDREKIYGSQLMSSQERAEYRANMRNMKTQQERNAYRIEHHKRMQQRAQERNATLPDNPPLKGGGMGPGGGHRGR